MIRFSLYSYDYSYDRKNCWMLEGDFEVCSWDSIYDIIEDLGTITTAYVAVSEGAVYYFDGVGNWNQYRPEDIPEFKKENMKW